jgi:hypothetical protein
MPMMGICVNIRVLVRSSHWDEMIVARRFRNCLRIIVSAKIVARCRRRGRACPAQKGRSKRRAVQWLFATDHQFHGMRFQVGSVFALASWHGSFSILSFETVSDAYPTKTIAVHKKRTFTFSASISFSKTPTLTSYLQPARVPPNPIFANLPPYLGTADFPLSLPSPARGEGFGIPLP